MSFFPVTIHPAKSKKLKSADSKIDQHKTGKTEQ